MPTTTRRPATDLAAVVGGIVAAEGYFFAAVDGNRFRLTLAFGAADQQLVDLLHDVFGCGSKTWYRRRKAHFDDEVAFVVRRTRDLVEVVVPFMDEHLPPSYKRHQYVVWRAALLDHWEHGARRQRPCTVTECTQVRRAKGLCRRHYYEAFRR